jgi:hypothetical protein
MINLQIAEPIAEPITEPIVATGVIVIEPEIIIVQPPVLPDPRKNERSHLCVICSVCGAGILTILCLCVPG